MASKNGKTPPRKLRAYSVRLESELGEWIENGAKIGRRSYGQQIGHIIEKARKEEIASLQGGKS